VNIESFFEYIASMSAYRTLAEHAAAGGCTDPMVELRRATTAAARYSLDATKSAMTAAADNGEEVYGHPEAEGDGGGRRTAQGSHSHPSPEVVLSFPFFCIKAVKPYPTGGDHVGGDHEAG